MRLFLLAFCLFFTVGLFSQPKGSEYVDMVYLKNGRDLRGTIVEYNYGEKVAIVLANGDLRELDWEEVRRVNFKLDKNRLRLVSRQEEQAQQASETAEPTPPVFTPKRTFQHQLTGAFNFGNAGSDFGFVSTTVGGSFAYHLVRQTGPVMVGLGADLSLMSSSRDENVVAVTGFGEYALGRKGKKVRPFFRFEAGPALPFSGDIEGGEIIERNINLLLHPSVGLLFGPGEGQWTSLFADIGYRFLDSKFTILTPNLDELERRVSYRRLVFRGGLRF